MKVVTIVELILTFSGIVTLCTGIFILYITKGSQNRTSSILFLGMTTSLSGWIFTNSFFYVVTLSFAEILAYASYAFGLGALMCALLLAESIAGVSNSSLKKRLYAGTVFSVLSAMPGVIASGVTDERKILSSNVAAYFLLPIILFCIISIRSTVVSLRDQEKNVRHDLGMILVGFVVAIFIGLLCNLIIPILFNSYSFVQLGPIGSLVFVSISAYILLKARFIDLRYVVIRATIYTVFTLSILIAISLVTTYSINLVLSYQENKNIVITFISLTMLLLGLIAQPVKNFIDKVSNRIFFQQNYSVHKTINSISSYATKNIDGAKIQKNTLSLIDSTINPKYGFFILLDSKKELRVSSSFGVTDPVDFYSIDFVKNIRRINKKTIARVNKENSLAEYFDKFDIGTITTLSTYGKTIGYLVLGSKKNGNQYNGHDLQLLDLVANDLALALENAQRYEEIKAFNETLQAKINDATKALKRTNAKLIALDDAKDEFISMASHQLRTPLTSVKGYISMLLEEDLGKINENQKQALKEAFDSSQRMVFLISDFLNVSRMRTGKFLLESKETDLTQIVIQEIQQLKEMAALRDQVVIYTAPKKFPIVMLDENKIRQVMMNMLDNAIFYTPRNGKITISLESTKDEIIYQVTDEGIGVPEKEQHRLFTKFFRAENARKARPDGTGLGLFMAQKVITEQGGSIIFKSKEGEGSTFGFRFPLEKISPAVDKK